jgi:hypothetical protein
VPTETPPEAQGRSWATIQQANEDSLKDEKGRVMPLSVMVARYIAAYGYSAWRSAAFPTSDGFVPYWEWLSMMQLIPMVAAHRKHEQMDAFRTGYLWCKAGEDSRSDIDKVVSDLHKQAFPEA